MSHRHIEVFVDALVMMSATLIIIVMTALRAQVIGRRLMNELGEADTIQIILDLLLLRLMLTPVLRLRLLNLVLGKIRLSRHGIRRTLILGLT